ncbi:unnamed protein product [Sphagnum jensenii]|uniref:Exosome complex component CSL4 C-terminal domain-containing protein n=1 Tax=Sphagnum jensenii TaxID=128206 RepID=A0ABP1A4X6_9BRYO
MNDESYEQQQQYTSRTPGESPTVEVRRQEEQGAVPEPGVVVTAKIRKVQPGMAVADVLCIGTGAVRENFRGIVRSVLFRQQDVHSTEIDKVDMHTSFCSSDIIRAEVVSSLLHSIS